MKKEELRIALNNLFNSARKAALPADSHEQLGLNAKMINELIEKSFSDQEKLDAALKENEQLKSDIKKLAATKKK